MREWRSNIILRSGWYSTLLLKKTCLEKHFRYPNLWEWTCCYISESVWNWGEADTHFCEDTLSVIGAQRSDTLTLNELLSCVFLILMVMLMMLSTGISSYLRHSCFSPPSHDVLKILIHFSQCVTNLYSFPPFHYHKLFLVPCIVCLLFPPGQQCSYIFLAWMWALFVENWAFLLDVWYNLGGFAV